MNKKEKEFLVQMALGVFAVDAGGIIWRKGELVGGGTSYLRMLPIPRKACTSIKTGYPVVGFTNDRERMFVAAHRIVWMVSNHSDIPEGLEINHKDGNRMNCHPSNLEVVTRQQNVNHGIEVLGRKPKAQNGEKNAMAKLTIGDVAKIRMLCKAGSLPQWKIAKMFGITQSAVSCVHLQKSWKAQSSTG